MSQCRYEWTDKEGEPCEGCGKSYEETRTIWDKAEDLYRTVVAYRFRPKNLWYTFKCWAWIRYTTVKPRTLGHGWCDRDGLLTHMVFEIARNFLEKEGPKSEAEWAEQAIANPGFYASWRETQEILDWWAARGDDYPWDMSDEEFDKLFPWTMPSDYTGTEDQYRSRERLLIGDLHEVQIREKAKRIIDISPYYWT